MISEEAFLNQYGAEFEGPRKKSTELRAHGACFNADNRELTLYLPGGPLTLAIDMLQGLRGLKAEVLENFEMLGTGIHWPEPNETFSVHGLLLGRFGNQAWMEMLAQEREIA